MPNNNKGRNDTKTVIMEEENTFRYEMYKVKEIDKKLPKNEYMDFTRLEYGTKEQFLGEQANKNAHNTEKNGEKSSKSTRAGTQR